MVTSLESGSSTAPYIWPSHGDNTLNAPAEFRHLQVESIEEVCVVRLLTEKLGTMMSIDSLSQRVVSADRTGEKRVARLLCRDANF